jgi:putative copper resistance protein D
MRWVYLISVWLHVVAAIVWIGGMLFLVLVVVPWLRSGARVDAGAFLRDTGARFRTVAWTCFATLFVTGAVNLWMRGVRPADLLRPAWLASPFGRAVGLKLVVFALVLGVSGIHDFVLGPRATAAIERDPRSPEAERIRRQASLLGRLNVVLALCLVALGVVLVRGWP